MLPARANPFRSERIESLRFRLAEPGWNALLDRFAAARWRGLLLGPHGSGKTTLREELEQRMRADGWTVRALVVDDRQRLRWADLAALIADATPRTLISIDGLDRVGAWQWWRLSRLTRDAGGVLATSHVCGRLPVLYQHHTSPELLEDLVCDLVGREHGAALRTRSRQLFTDLCGDVRACLRQLYEDAATDALVPDTVG